VSILLNGVTKRSVHPFLRIWAVAAVCVALLLVVRGAWQLALVVLFFSPLPELVVAHYWPSERRPSISWVAFLSLVVAIGAVLFLVVVHLGGIPPVHEWRHGFTQSAN
jgi:hypothetical protein